MDLLPADDLGTLTDSLNPAQRDAVTAPLQHCLVLAGAGSGKTRVLVHRVAWLIAAEGASPQSILAVTFTNKAAGEMRGRLEGLLALPVRALWVGTFHGIAHRMLRLHWKEANLPQNFQILDADDQQRFVKRVLKNMDLAEDRWPPRTVTSWINSQKEEGRRPKDIQDSGDFSQKTLVRIYANYQDACEQGGLVDFTELLLRAYELCRDHAGIQGHYRRRFRHILVDEFQDTNALQYEWLKVLAGDAAKMFAVGDDDQSIYGWRGARVENLHKLQKDFRGCLLVRLEQNYRSSGTILKAANGLIQKNTGRLGKSLWTDTGDGEPVRIYAAFNDYDEAEFVLNRIREYLAKGLRHVELAILYRSNAQSRLLEEQLVRARIPYRIYGGLRFFERMEVKDALAYLRLVANSADDAAFERAVNTPTRGIGTTTLERLRALALERKSTMWAAATECAPLLGRSAGAVQQFTQLICMMKDLSAAQRLGDVMEMVIAQSGLREHYRKEKGEAGEARLENLDELVSAARAGEHPDEDGVDPLTAFITHAALEAGEEQAAAGEDCVQLMTLHSAKGLEFPVVFMVGMEEGLFPHIRAVQDGNLEEERRLCYVGITRAMRQLFISHADLRRVHGVEQMCTPSRFVRELPPECVQELRARRTPVLRATYERREDGGGGRGGYGGYGGSGRYDSGGGGSGGGNSGYGNRSSSGYARAGSRDDAPREAPPAWAGAAAGPQTGGLKLGQRVTHARFGEGVVMSFDGDGERTQVEVRFRESGTKRLIVAMAKLQPL